MKEVSLEALIELAYEHARRVLIERRAGIHPQLAPAWLTVADGVVTITVTPFANDREKDWVVAAMRKAMLARGVIAYSFVSEAWEASQTHEWEPKRDKPPSERPDREEIVIAVASNRTRSTHATWVIKRDKRGDVTALERRVIGDEIRSGRFDNLLATQQ